MYTNIKLFKESLIKESTYDGYNLGLNTDKKYEYEFAIAEVLSDLPGMEEFYNRKRNFVSDLASLIIIEQFGKVDNTEEIKKRLKDLDPNINVDSIKNNFDGSSRTTEDVKQDLWKYYITKHKSVFDFRKLNNGRNNDTELTREITSDIIDMMAPYSYTQHQLADTNWTRLKELLSAAEDHMSERNYDKFLDNVAKKYPLLK